MTEERLHDRDSGNGSHEETLEDLVWKYVEAFKDGQTLDKDAILHAHPSLGRDLIQHLEAFHEIGGEGSDDVPLGTLGDYTLRRQIGRGGMGVVYEAWQNSVERSVALKVLPAGFAADNKTFVRFMREAKTAAQLHHPNIVGVHGMGVEENTPYYAMELVEGETLAQVLAKIKDAEPETDTPFGKKDDVAYFGNLARAFADVADGLQHAHSKGVVHRDIKPSNLILDGEGKLRILDFGLAHLEGQESLTLSGDVVGTPLYMSPEQAQRKKIPIDHRTDIYSLGATMYEALTGRPPFRGKDHADTLSQIIEEDQWPLHRLNQEIPKDLETIVLKCLRKDPKDRYETAEALAHDLRRFVRGDPIEARPQPGWERLGRRIWKHRLKVGVTAMILALLFILSPLMLEPEGMVVRQIWAPAADMHGRPSPDGRYFPYTDWETGDLAVRDLLTGENRRLTNNGSLLESGEFAHWSVPSPDGQQLCYGWFNKDFLYELRLIAIDGSNPQVLYRNEDMAYMQPDAWSPDGKHILAQFTRKDGANQIGWVSLADGSLRVLKTMDWRYPSEVSLSPDGRFIAYDFAPEEHSRQRDIFVLAADGSREIPLVQHPANDLLLGWAPDGKRILFASDRTGSVGLWVLQVAAGTPQGSPRLVKKDIGRVLPLGVTRDGAFFYAIPTGMSDVYIATLDLATGKVLAPPAKATERSVGSNGLPDWSPDGKYLAYVSQPLNEHFSTGLDSRVIIQSVETGEERDFSPELKHIGGIRWSPDGRSLLVVGYDKSRIYSQSLYRMDTQTGEVIPILRSHHGESIRDAVPSSDGRTIFYHRDDVSPKVCHFIARDLETGREKELLRMAAPSYLAGGSALSPDGRQLAFTTFEPGTGALKVMPVQGGEGRELVRVKGKSEFIFGAAWTPDGRQLLFTKVTWPSLEPAGLWRVSAEGGEAQKLEHDLDILPGVRVHPDGRQLVFTSGQPYKLEIWVLENFLPKVEIKTARLEK